MGGTRMCVYGFICPCTHVQRPEADVGCLLLLSALFPWDKILSLNPSLFFKCGWWPASFPVILFYFLLVLELQVYVGDGLLFYSGSGDLNLGPHACAVKCSHLLSHPLIPWKNIFALVVDSHNQIDGILPIVMTLVQSHKVCPCNAYVLKILF